MSTLDKQDWVAVSTLTDLETELTIYMETSHAPVLVAFSMGLESQWQAEGRIFVMSNDWLNTP